MTKTPTRSLDQDYSEFFNGISELLDDARRVTVRSVNSIMTATYWEIGRRIVETEQSGAERAEYGATLLKRLSQDLKTKFGRGFSDVNLRHMRRFYLVYAIDEKQQSVSAISEQGEGKQQALPAESHNMFKSLRFPLPWTHYVKLLAVEDKAARDFYADEAIRGGWSSRQLERQIGSQYYQRMLLSQNKSQMLQKAEVGEVVNPHDEIKDPYVLEFLDLKDEYSEFDLEEALIHKLEDFLLELGGDFTFVGRQRRLRIGDQWFRVDLLFFHRKLRCLVIIDLKLTEFSHADAGQMHMYLNYAKEHWTLADENPPVGLILCAAKDAAVAHYALEGLPNQVMAAEYRMKLPDEETLVAELRKTRAMLNSSQPSED